MRDAVKKYKRNAISSEVSPLPSLFTPRPKATTASTIKSKTRSFPKKQAHHKKNKVLGDIAEMYAVGLSLTK